MSSKASVTSLFNSHARHVVFFFNTAELYFSVKAWKTGRVRDFPREEQIPLKRKVAPHTKRYQYFRQLVVG